MAHFFSPPQNLHHHHQPQNHQQHHRSDNTNSIQLLHQYKSVGSLFQPWSKPWGLRGDPFLWEELSQVLAKEPLPASLTQLVALIEKSFEQLVGCSLSTHHNSVYVERYDRGGISGGHICFAFWKGEAIPEIQRNYLALMQPSNNQLNSSGPSNNSFASSKGPKFIDKPCRYELYPEGCRFGNSCRFRHSLPPRTIESAIPYMQAQTHALDRTQPQAYQAPINNNNSDYRPNYEHTKMLPNNSGHNNGTIFGGSGSGSGSSSMIASALDGDVSFSRFQPAIGIMNPHKSSSSSSSAFSSGIETPSYPFVAFSSDPNTLCPNFMRGSCDRGDFCRFKHM